VTARKLVKYLNRHCGSKQFSCKTAELGYLQVGSSQYSYYDPAPKGGALSDAFV